MASSGTDKGGIRHTDILLQVGLADNKFPKWDTETRRYVASDGGSGDDTTQTVVDAIATEVSGGSASILLQDGTTTDVSLGDLAADLTILDIGSSPAQLWTTTGGSANSDGAEDGDYIAKGMEVNSANGVTARVVNGLGYQPAVADGNADSRSIIDVTSDGDGDSTGTLYEVDPNLVKEVRVHAGEGDERARIQLPDPSLWAGLDVMIHPYSLDCKGPSVWWRTDPQSPATIQLGDFSQFGGAGGGIFNLFATRPGFDFSGENAWSITLTVIDGTPTPVTVDFNTDMSDDGSEFIGALIAGFTSIGTLAVGFDEDLGVPTVITFTSTATGAGVTISSDDTDDLTDAFVGDDGADLDPAFHGWDLDELHDLSATGGEARGHDGTHGWPDVYVPNRCLRLASTGTRTIALQTYQRSYMTYLGLPERGGPLDDSSRSQNALLAWNTVNSIFGLSVPFAFSVTDRSAVAGLTDSIRTWLDSQYGIALTFVPFITVYDDDTADRWVFKSDNSLLGPFTICGGGTNDDTLNVGRLVSATALYDDAFPTPTLIEDGWIRRVAKTGTGPDTFALQPLGFVSTGGGISYGSESTVPVGPEATVVQQATDRLVLGQTGEIGVDDESTYELLPINEWAYKAVTVVHQHGTAPLRVLAPSDVSASIFYRGNENDLMLMTPSTGIQSVTIPLGNSVTFFTEGINWSITAIGGGGNSLNVRTVNDADDALLVDDDVVRVLANDPRSFDISAAAYGVLYRVRALDASSSTVTLDDTGGGPLDGVSLNAGDVVAFMRGPDGIEPASSV